MVNFHLSPMQQIHANVIFLASVRFQYVHRKGNDSQINYGTIKQAAAKNCICLDTL